MALAPLGAPEPQGTGVVTDDPGGLGVLGGFVGDTALGIAAGVPDVVGQIASTAGRWTGSETLQKIGALSAYAADLVRDQMSAAGKAAAGASWIGEEGKPSAWHSPGRSLTTQIGGAALPIAATALQPRLAPAIWGAAGVGQLNSEAAKDAWLTPEAELRDRYPEYGRNLDAGMPDNEARKALVEARTGATPQLVAGITGAAGGVPLGHALKPMTAGLLRRMATSAAEGAVGGVIGGAGYDVAHQMGEVDAGGQAEVDPMRAVRAGLNMGVMGGGIGAAFGGARRAPAKTVVPPEIAAALNPNLPAATMVPRGGSRRPGQSLNEPTPGTWAGIDPYRPFQRDVMMPEGDETTVGPRTDIPWASMQGEFPGEPRQGLPQGNMVIPFPPRPGPPVATQVPITEAFRRQDIPIPAHREVSPETWAAVDPYRPFQRDVMTPEGGTSHVPPDPEVPWASLQTSFPGRARARLPAGRLITPQGPPPRIATNVPRDGSRYPGQSIYEPRPGSWPRPDGSPPEGPAGGSGGGPGEGPGGGGGTPGSNLDGDATRERPPPPGPAVWASGREVIPVIVLPGLPKTGLDGTMHMTVRRVEDGALQTVPVDELLPPDVQARPGRRPDQPQQYTPAGAPTARLTVMAEQPFKSVFGRQGEQSVGGPPSGEAEVGRRSDMLKRVAAMRPGDNVVGPEGETLRILSVGTGADPMVVWRHMPDSMERLASQGVRIDFPQGTTRASEMARAFLGHDVVGADGVRRTVGEAKIRYPRDVSRTTERVRTGAIEVGGPLAEGSPLVRGRRETPKATVEKIRTTENVRQAERGAAEVHKTKPDVEMQPKTVEPPPVPKTAEEAQARADAVQEMRDAADRARAARKVEVEHEKTRAEGAVEDRDTKAKRINRVIGQVLKPLRKVSSIFAAHDYNLIDPRIAGPRGGQQQVARKRRASRTTPQTAVERQREAERARRLAEGTKLSEEMKSGRDAARQLIMDDARAVVAALKKALSPGDFAQIMVKRARRTKVEMEANVASEYPQRHAARLIYRLVTAVDRIERAHAEGRIGPAERKVTKRFSKDIERKAPEQSEAQRKLAGEERDASIAAKQIDAAYAEFREGMEKLRDQRITADEGVEKRTPERIAADEADAAARASGIQPDVSPVQAAHERAVTRAEGEIAQLTAVVQAAERRATGLAERDKSNLSIMFKGTPADTTAAFNRLARAERDLAKAERARDALLLERPQGEGASTEVTAGKLTGSFRERIEAVRTRLEQEDAEAASGGNVEGEGQPSATYYNRAPRLYDETRKPSEVRTPKNVEALKKRLEARYGTTVKRASTAEAEAPTQEHLVERYGNTGDAPIVSTSGEHVDTAISDMRANADAGPPAERAKAHAAVDLMEAIMQRLTRNTREVPTHVVDRAEIEAEVPGAAGLYTYTANIRGQVKNGLIRLAREAMSGRFGPGVALHEATHPAIEHGLARDPVARRDMGTLGEHLQRYIDNNPEQVNRHGLDADDLAEVGKMANPYETAQIGLSNEKLQRMMIEVPAPAQIRMKYHLDRRSASVWDGFVATVARMFGLRRAEFSTLDAMLTISDQLAEHVPPRGDGITPGSKVTRPAFLPAGVGEAMDSARKSMTNTGDLAGRVYRGMASTTSIVRSLNRYVSAIPGDARGRTNADMVAEHLQKMEHQRDTTVENEYLPLAEEGQKLRAKYGAGEKWQDWQEFQIAETMSGVDASRPIAAQLRRPSVPKGQPQPDQTGRHLPSDPDAPSNVQKIALYPELRKQWEALPPDLQAFHKKLQATYERDHNETARGLLRNLIEVVRPENEPRMSDAAAYALADRMRDDTMTPAEEAKYKGSLLIKAIRDSRALAKTGGPFAPLSRVGDYVVHGRYEYEVPRGGQQLDADGKQSSTGNYFRFDTPEQRRAFDLKYKEHKSSGHSNVYFDKATGVRITGPDGKKAFDAGTADVKYQLRLQDKLVEFHETLAEARASHAEWDRQIREGGVKLKMMGDEPRRMDVQEQARSFLDQPFQRALEELKKTPGWDRLSETQKGVLSEVTREAGLRAMGSTRIQSKRIKRRYVAGASTDFMRTFGQFGVSSAGYRAHLTHMRPINEHMKALDDERKAGLESGHKSEITYPRAALIDELRQRADVRDLTQRTGWDKASSTAISRFMQLTNAAKLGSVAYHITNGMEPDMVAAPILAARFGAGKVHMALRAAERALGMGATIKMGASETLQSLLKGPRRRDFNKPIIDRVAAGPDGAVKADLLREAVERGHMQRNAGMEFYQIALPSRTKAGRAIDYVDSAARQMGVAMEAINRAKVLLASFDLARGSGMSVEMAKQFAFDTNIQSMGDYSAWNTAPLLKHPFVKPAFQFKRYGLKTYELMGHQIRDYLDHTKSPEDRRIAIAAFRNLLLRHAIMAGVNGLPLEPIRIALLAAGVVGFGYSWEDLQQDMRKTVADTLGSDAGEIWAGGLPRFLGIDFSQRMNLSQLVTPFDPKSSKPDDTKAWLASIILGAPGDQMVNYWRAMEDLSKGNYTGFLAKMQPFKVTHDLIVAGQNIYQGGPQTSTGKDRGSPPDFLDTLATAAGFQSGRMAEQTDYRNAILRQKAVRHTERNAIVQDYVNADDGAGRDAAWQRAIRYNDNKIGPERITRGALEKSRASRARAAREDEFGVSLDKSDKSLRDMRQYYNVGT